MQPRRVKLLQDLVHGVVGQEADVRTPWLDLAGLGLELFAREMQVDFLLTEEERMSFVSVRISIRVNAKSVGAP